MVPVALSVFLAVGIIVLLSLVIAVFKSVGGVLDGWVIFGRWGCVGWLGNLQSVGVCWMVG